MSKVKTPTQERADALGIKYHHLAKDETIQKLIDKHLAENATEEDNPYNFDYIPDAEPMRPGEYEAKYNSVGVRRKQANRLIRCRIQCMNPAKREWPGEIISVGSARLGTFKKFIPFNSPDPYHIPKIIYDMLREKKCTIFHTVSDDRGNKIRKGRLVDEYAIEVLDPLTPEELSDLAKQQALKAGQQ